MTQRERRLLREKHVPKQYITLRQPERCPRCKRLTVDAWVHRLNVAAWHLYELECAMHPSAWQEGLQPYRDDYARLASSATCACVEEDEERRGLGC